MRPMTSHVTEEDLVLRYYGEPDDETRVEEHLAGCAACRERFDRLRATLSMVDGEHVPDLPPDFENRVWTRLERTLPRRTRWRFPIVEATPRWVMAGGMAALLFLAFVAGRLSNPDPVAPIGDTATAGDSSERVMVLAVVDHLDRSQMILLELMNADLEAPATDFAAERSKARELVAESRLYRLSALQVGDRTTSDVLDELERTLIELANTPPDATREEVDALRARIAARGLLFKVRVVHSEMQQRERATMMSGSTS